jgi:hypothetical protein
VLEEGGNEELFYGYGVSVLQEEKGSGDGLHINVNTPNATELYT